MKPITLLVLFALAVSCNSCELFFPEPKTELEKLPPITQTGRYNFGCLVNDKAVYTYNSMTMRAEHHKQFSEFIIQFGITVDGRLYSDPLMDFNFHTSDLLEVGMRYPLTDPPSSGIQLINFVDGYAVNCLYDYNNTFDGYITFSNIDRTKYIISGTFEFSTVTQSCDTVIVKEGRFDMGYFPY